MNILLIGNGSREHAIAKAIKKSRYAPKLFAYGESKNPGIYDLSEEYYVGNTCDPESVLEFAKTHSIDITIIGPENPLAAGVVDILKENNIPSTAPSKSLARLESSKGFTRDLLEKYKIPGNPIFKIFEGSAENNRYDIKEFLKELNGNYVVKYDALYGGKGVKVSGEHLYSIDEGVEYAMECLNKCGKVVIDEKLIGEEFSLIAITDGITVIETPAIQDHKRLNDGDMGPNTGGMGTYSDVSHSLPFLIQKNIDEAHAINVSVIKALEKECGEKYKGAIYGGFIVTKYGVRLIEYNARFGDPEAMNIFSLLKTDFVDICKAIINEDLKNLYVKFEKQATVCKYIVPKGYPNNPTRGEKIIIGNIPKNCEMFYGSVNLRDNNLIMTGSRAVAFVGKGNSISEAEAVVSAGIAEVHGNVFYRTDIGTIELLQKRIDHMNDIRGHL